MELFTLERPFSLQNSDFISLKYQIIAQPHSQDRSRSEKDEPESIIAHLYSIDLIHHMIISTTKQQN
ncbi:hypothetical protein L1987_35592 [Smallanthus sonchifolius]|uniref:Uncharacterized protein n=1 Tax=Smallanthus sonchifolius TaxID=185202 RepID=A0ACB9HCS9_9ASTR|nr:hypothetical protein L1987_35592 [Smallanthus sonchifolius]